MSQKEKLLHEVKNYLKENYAQTISLDEIAGKIHISQPMGIIMRIT
jgi:predicted DNA-binding protein YlxM (UPF0122 family)